MPIKEKISKLTVCLDKSLGGTELGTAEVDMGNYSYGQYNVIKLNLEQCPSNTEYPFDPSETVLEVGLKGTRADGLVQKRMSAIKQQMADNIKKQLNPAKSPNHKEVSQINEAMQAMMNSEIERIKKEQREAAKVYEKKLLESNVKINGMLTSVENYKTDLERTDQEKAFLEKENSLLEKEIQACQQQIEEEQGIALKIREKLLAEIEEKKVKSEEVKWLKQEL